MNQKSNNNNCTKEAQQSDSRDNYKGIKPQNKFTKTLNKKIYKELHLNRPFQQEVKEY